MGQRYFKFNGEKVSVGVSYAQIPRRTFLTF